MLRPTVNLLYYLAIQHWFENIISFQKKLELFKSQFSMSVSVLTQFPYLKNQHHEDKDINYLKYSTMVAGLADALILDFWTFEHLNVISAFFQPIPGSFRSRPRLISTEID